MNKILKLTLILFLVCAVTAGILGFVYEITIDKITYQNQLKTENAYKAVLPEFSADSASDISFDAAKIFNEFGVNISKISKCGEGYVVESSFSGAQGTITMAAGVKDEKCTGISIISHSETSGLGANAASTAEVGVNFRAQFLGVGRDVKLAKKGGTIDALAGATITSTAVTNATAASIAAVEYFG